MLYKTAVGELLLPEKTRYPEGAIFEYTESGPIFILAFGNPTQKEIEGAKSGQIEMAFYEQEHVVFVCIKVQGCGGWMDAPFSIRLYDNKTFDWSEPIDEGKGLGITIIMVDANTGIVKSQRLIGAASDFSRKLRAAITQQYEKPFIRDKYTQEINKIYQNLTSDDIAKRAIGHFRIKKDNNT